MARFIRLLFTITILSLVAVTPSLVQAQSDNSNNSGASNNAASNHNALEKTDAFDKISESERWALRRPGTPAGPTVSELKLKIEIDVDAIRDNSDKPEEFKSEIEVKLQRNNKPVRDAQITVSAYDGPTVALPLKDGKKGKYEADIVGYHRAYRVDVRAGDDRIDGIYLAGPAIHAFSTPAHMARVSNQKDLQLRWNADDKGADRVRLKGDGFKSVELAKNATDYKVPRAKLADDDDDEFELKRANRMILPGLAEGSVFEIEVENEIEVKFER